MNKKDEYALPELPPMRMTIAGDGPDAGHWYSADQMRDYGQQCYDAVRDFKPQEHALAEVSAHDNFGLPVVKWLCRKSPNIGTKLYASQLALPAGPVPEGWKLVPKRATRDMLIAAGFKHGDGEEQWEAMISAAPQPPVASPAGSGPEIISDLRHSAKVDGYTEAQAKFINSIADRLSSAAAPVFEKFYAVLSPFGNDGVLFKDKANAYFTATGESKSWGTPTIGEAFRESYAEHGAMFVREVFLQSPAVAQPVADEREAFEEWHGGMLSSELAPDGQIHYTDSRTDGAWCAWQARAALGQPAKEGEQP